jgi:hypothetical protein
MKSQQLNRVSGGFLIALSLTALFAVIGGYSHPLLPDEGAAAHIFQLAILALVPITIIFLATHDWTKPWPRLRFLVFPAALLAIAFAALYYLEHYR